MAGLARLFARGAAIVTTARPVLGVICCGRAVGVEAAQVVMRRYLEAAMTYADAAALLVPAMPALMAAHEVAPRLDGLLLTGSPSNVEPLRYGEGDAIDPAGPWDPGRDAMAAALTKALLDRGKPVFGVCRGFQELNVVFGGTLRRDASAAEDLLAHHAPTDADLDADLDALFAHEHEVALAPGGLLHAAYGRDRLRVNSVHYQGVGRLGHGLTVEARAPDGLVEAVSARVDGAPVLAVQWHPEWRTEANPQSQTFFGMLGHALRGEPLVPDLPASDLRTSS